MLILGVLVLAGKVFHYMYLDLLSLIDGFFLKMKPSVSISFLAFHTKVAMVTETASVRLFSPAFDKVTSDLTLSVNLVRVMVLAVALIALSISFKIPARYNLSFGSTRI